MGLHVTPPMPDLPAGLLDSAAAVVRNTEPALLAAAFHGNPDAQRMLAERVLRAALPRLITTDTVRQVEQAIADAHRQAQHRGAGVDWCRLAAQGALTAALGVDENAIPRPQALDPFVFVAAARYATGRQTGAAETIAAQVIGHADLIRQDTAAVRAICGEIDEFLHGDSVDLRAKALWQQARDALTDTGMEAD